MGSVKMGPYVYEITRGGDLVSRFITGEIKSWDLNRPIAFDTVEVLFELWSKKSTNIFAPNLITICRLHDNLLLVDGQHRLSVLERIHLKFGPSVTNEIMLMVCYYDCKTIDDIKECFCNINSGTPVPSSYFDDAVAETINRYYDALSIKFPSFVSESVEPRRPYFSKQKIHRQLSSFTGVREGILAHQITAEILYTHTIVVNTNRKQMYTEMNRKELDKLGITENMFKFASQRGEFYCGLSKEWISEVAAGLKLEISKYE
jgi:hypothetical protein